MVPTTMKIVRERDMAKGPTYWSRKWNTARKKARQILIALHKKYGTSVVWRTGLQGRYVTSEAALASVKELGQLHGHGEGSRTPSRRGIGTGSVEYHQENVTHEQLQQALQEIWASIREIRAALKLGYHKSSSPFGDK